MGGVPPLSEERLRKVVEAYKDADGNKSEAARQLGMSRTTFADQYRKAERRGFTGRATPAPDGFEIKQLTETVDQNGVLKRQSTKYTPAPGHYQLPEGMPLKGVSLLSEIDEDGEKRARLVWEKAGTILDDPLRVSEIVKKAFEDFKPFAPAIIRAKNHDDKKLTVFPLADWHIGMFSWGRENDGPDWDLSIARNTLVETFAELVDQAPLSYHAVILGLGDLLHADTPKNQTPNSGNVMDVDTRYAKCLPAVCDIITECCEMVRQKHKLVEVAIKAGNHDIASTVGIRSALRMYYRNDSRIEVDDSPSPYYWKRFGTNLIAGTHGDGCKAKDLPLFMANIKSTEWAETKSKHAHTGHLHNEMTFEHGGVKVHQHRAPIPQDAWHHAQGYRSGRSMRAFHYHFDKGARGSSEVEIL